MDNYYNPRFGLSSPYKFYKGQHDLTLEQINNQVKKQEAYQLNKQGKTYFFPIVGRGAGSYQADLMFPNKVRGYTCILAIINVNTRFAYCYAMKSKSDTYNYLKEWVKNDGIEYLQTDLGTEFNNTKVKNLMKDNNIDLYFVDKADHTGQGKIERFNETLRRLITLYETSHSSNDWVSVLDDLVYNYNHRFHRSLGCSPIEASEEDQFYKQLHKYDIAEKQFSQFHVGDKVRLLQSKELFDKGRKIWSHEVYRIRNIDGHRVEIDGEWYKYDQIQKVITVHKKIFDDEPLDTNAIKKDKKVVRDIRKEGVSDTNVIKYGKELVNRRVKGGVIFKYDRNGPFHWWVRFDDPNRDDEAMNLNEIKAMMI